MRNLNFIPIEQYIDSGQKWQKNQPRGAQNCAFLAQKHVVLSIEFDFYVILAAEPTRKLGAYRRCYRANNNDIEGQTAN